MTSEHNKNTARRRVASSRPSLLAAGPGTRRLRLATGLVLFAYVATHLLDASLGNAGIAAMDGMLVVQKWVWQGVLGTLLLWGSLTVHAALGVWSLYARRYVGWTPIEILQLALGLAVPPLLANHATVTRLALTLYSHDKTYVQELHALWLASPFWGVVQVGVLLVAWTHACLGLLRALKLYAGFAPWRQVALAGTVLLPVTAMLGFAQGVREQARAEATPGWHADPARVEQPAQAAALRAVRNGFLVAYGAAIAAVLTARVWRRQAETGRRGILVRYPNGRTVRMPAGLSILDASRLAGIAHASVCGGRGRCSTCRIRVVARREHLPSPSAGERRVLDWVGVDPQRVRLACQLRPTGEVAVTPLVAPEAARGYLAGHAPGLAGEERFVAALFVDLRDSTALAEAHLPYDSVFLVGRFVAAVTEAIVAAGGRPNQFLGDGVLALFGLDGPPPAACRAALNAVAGIKRSVDALNAGATGPMLHAAIGLHCGAAIVGEIGFGNHVTVTALGDPVNIAARLQEMTRDLGCKTAISESVFAVAQVTPAGAPRVVAIRGRTAVLPVRLHDIVPPSMAEV